MTAPVKKRDQAAALVRARIADGTLKPGMTAPSGEQLARETGFAVMTCRAALRILLDEGALTRVSQTGRGRVADADAPGDGRDVELARELAARRGDAGLTQQELADKLGVSLTTVGHAETGRAVAVPARSGTRRTWRWTPTARCWPGTTPGRSALRSARGRAAAVPVMRAIADPVGAPAVPAPPDLPDGMVITLPCDPMPVTVRWGDGSVTTAQPGPG